MVGGRGEGGKVPAGEEAAGEPLAGTRRITNTRPSLLNDILKTGIC